MVTSPTLWTCPTCGQDFTQRGKSRHKCSNQPHKPKRADFHCIYCGEEFSDKGITNHERMCANNPARKPPQLTPNSMIFLPVPEPKPIVHQRCAGCGYTPCCNPMVCGPRLRALAQHKRA